jgi:integrase
MQTLPPRRSLGSITWRERRGAFEIRLRERTGAPRTSTYIAGPNTEERRRAAELALAERIAKLARGERHLDQRLTVGTWLDTWLELQVDLKPKTILGYRSKIDRYLKPTFGRYRLAELDVDDVTRGFAKLRASTGKRTQGEPLSVGTVDGAKRILGAALQAAVVRRLVTWNAVRGANVPRPSTHVEPPTQDELDRLFAAIGDHPFRPIYELMRWTGIRHGEVLGLTWRRCRNLEAGVLEIVKQADGGTTKSGRTRSVLVPPHVAALVRAIPRRVGSDLVFSDAQGGPLRQGAVLDVFDRALLAAGIAPHPDADLDKYRPHDLRHAFATLLLEAGVSHSFTAATLGHASLAMLDRYSHVRTIGERGDSYRRLAAAWGGSELYLFGLRPAA